MLRRAAAMGMGRVGGGGWYAVGHCTESLGSETGDVGGDAEIERQLAAAAAAGTAAAEEEEQVVEEETLPPPPPRRCLPPAMPRAADAFVMRAERRGGRLILTKVRAEQPRREVFRASRADGRLRLRFADDDDDFGVPDGVGEDDGTPAAAKEAVVSGGAGELSCQVAAGGAAGARVEIVAVMGI